MMSTSGVSTVGVMMMMERADSGLTRSRFEDFNGFPRRQITRVLPVVPSRSRIMSSISDTVEVGQDCHTGSPNTFVRLHQLRRSR